MHFSNAHSYFRSKTISYRLLLENTANNGDGNSSGNGNFNGNGNGSDDTHSQDHSNRDVIENDTEEVLECD